MIVLFYNWDFVLKFSWLILLFISDLDIVLTMLFNIPLVNNNIIISFLFISYFFILFLFTFSTVKENAKLKLALTTPTDAPITLARRPVLVADKTIKV